MFERSDMARNRERGLGLEEQVLDEYPLVGSVLGLEVSHRFAVRKGDEAVGDAPVGLAQDVAVAVAIAERRDQAGVGVGLGREAFARFRQWGLLCSDRAALVRDDLSLISA